MFIFLQLNLALGAYLVVSDRRLRFAVLLAGVQVL
jgi:hypothetical protein